MSKPVRTLLNASRALTRPLGFELVKYRTSAATEAGLPPDFTAEEVEIVCASKPFSLTSPERLHALIQAVRYVTRARIPGAIVECGVWKGGSVVCALRTLLAEGDTSRDVYLFDTFEGMPEPTERDVDLDGRRAADMMDAPGVKVEAGLDEVRRNVLSVGYPEERLHFVKGMVEETIPGAAPEQIALLRLDTDWYASTRHELNHLYPRLSSGGVLIIDDYGHFKGAREATDEYIRENNLHLLLNRVDYTCRIAVKP